jgi:sterol desaturase/sphingolipid hydroxylase (fatty acid hydroxylase superfamily)
MGIGNVTQQGQSSWPSREPHRPMVQILLGPLLGLCFEKDTVAFYTGGGGTVLSDMCGLLSCWLMFYVAILIFYHVFAPLSRAFHAWKYPNAPTSRVAPALVKNMIEVSRQAFPLYVTVPMLGDFFRWKGWGMTCDSIQECGGWGPALLSCLAYFFAVEFLIFWDHYYLLHKSPMGKRMMQHAQHHVYKYADQLNAFSGYAFAPQDGWSQGLPLALCTLFIPVPLAFVYLLEVLTGFWTLYIHTDTTPLPWPFMGCDYHYIHHKYNWYNFGFMTLLFDTLFGTVKHPSPDALGLSHGRLPMSISELEKSAALTQDILKQRTSGPAAMSMLEADAAAGGWSGARDEAAGGKKQD